MQNSIYIDTNVLIFTTTTKFHLKINNIPKIDKNPIFLDTFLTILGILTIDGLDYLFYVARDKKLSENVHKIEKLSYIALNDSDQNKTKIKNLCKFIENNNFFIKRECIEEEFTWNKKMRKSFSERIVEWEDWPEEDELLCYLFCGYYGSSDLGLEILSMISCDKIGPRLYCRGIDDKGSVSFFVKTQISCRGFNFTILRGSIPLFWYQDKNPLRSDLKYSREKDVSKEAFKRHFDKLFKEYGKICVINLLGNNSNEKHLSDAYIELLKENNIEYIYFDLNKHANDFEKLKNIFTTYIEKYHDYVFRVNCLDCMDRTNVAQYLVIEYFLSKKLEANFPNLDAKKLFVENGHALSNFYCGADSLKSELSLKGKRSFGGFFDDMLINANRVFQGKFSDKIKYEMINTILDKYSDEDNDSVASQELNMTCKSMRVFILSWCINRFRFEDCFTYDFINFDDDCSILVISLQKLHISYKKILLDKKENEREKWKEYFESKVGSDFVLVSTNFTHDIGILLFAKKNISNSICKIKTDKQKYSLFNKGISVSIIFNLYNEKFVFLNNTLTITNDNLKAIAPISDNSYLFMTGHFDTPLHINTNDYEHFEKYFEYEKIYTNDFLFKNSESLFNLSEATISFLPNGKSNNKPKYFTRIFFSKRIEAIDYKDILYYVTGFRPIYGKYYLE